jgi:hypothetical protein
MMTPAQKEFLRSALADRCAYTVCNDSVLCSLSSGEQDRVDTLGVLEALCSRILSSRVHADSRVRVGVCNIILQRVQSVVPISRNIQQQLNQALFRQGSCEEVQGSCEEVGAGLGV